MKNLLLFISFLLLSGCASSQKIISSSTQITPEAQGISSSAILGFVDALEKELPDAIHSIMLRRHGKIIAEGYWTPFNLDSPHYLYSLSKSFTSTAIGMAQEEGLLSINDPVISFFPEEVPENPSNNLKSMRIKDLLRMNTGHQNDTWRKIRNGENWVKTFLALEVEHKPGTHFQYNTGATYMLSAILQKISGETLLDYLTPRLFEPLGIDNPIWETDPNGISKGGTGLSVRTRDISNLGQLYLQKGKWNGKQLIPEVWVEEATSFQTSNGSDPNSDWDQGYGYQFWRNRNNAYSGVGAFGQLCIIMPEQDAVIAITSGTSNMRKILELVWEYLLPAMQDKPLPADKQGLGLLREKLKNLAISTVAGEKSSPLASKISGKTFVMEANNLAIESVTFGFEADPDIISIQTGGGEQSFKAGYNTMVKGIMQHPQLSTNKIAVSGAWESPDQYAVNIFYYETTQTVRFTYRFEEDKVTWDTDLNTTMNPSSLKQLKGWIKAD